MRFIDEAEISVAAGNGGAGSASFHRAAFVPNGGPDGGDGGRGGSVKFIASAQLGTLEDVTLKRHYNAENGKPGLGNRKNGKKGKDCIIRVPVGTIIFDRDTEVPLSDLTEDKQVFTAAEGGKGGWGNFHFKSSRNRTPRRTGKGTQGEHRNLRLELKLIADVGLVGKPNAGKSTLLAALTDANPKIASYPYSTLYPSLGIMNVGIYERISVADIPGLGENASKGGGLGRRFLRHIERTRLMVILIEAQEANYKTAYEQLTREINSFSPELKHLRRIVIMSKADLNGNGGDFKFTHRVSALSGEGISELVQIIREEIKELDSLIEESG